MLKRFKSKQLLRGVITADCHIRQWKKRSEASEIVAKRGLTNKKVLLCYWWDNKGISHYELVEPGQRINSDVQCQKPKKFYEDEIMALLERWRKVIDNNGQYFD